MWPKILCLLQHTFRVTKENCRKAQLCFHKWAWFQTDTAQTEAYEFLSVKRYVSIFSTLPKGSPSYTNTCCIVLQTLCPPGAGNFLK